MLCKLLLVIINKLALNKHFYFSHEEHKESQRKMKEEEKYIFIKTVSILYLL